MTGLSLPNNVTSSYDYDGAGRLILLSHSNLTETLAAYDYALDRVGNRTTLTETLVAVQPIPAGAYLENSDLVVLEAENFADQTGSLTHDWQIQTGQPGYTGTAYIQPLPDLDALVQTGEITASPRVEFSISFSTPDTYTVWLRGYPANAAGDSAYLSLAEQTVGLTGFGPGQYGHVLDEMFEEARQMGSRNWEAQVRTQADLERWADVWPASTAGSGSVNASTGCEAHQLNR